MKYIGPEWFGWVLIASVIAGGLYLIVTTTT